MKTELLLPVGNMSMLLAAIHHGADAVYIGVPYFNARGRSTDIDLADLKEMIDLAHLYQVKVNLAFNVVIFQNEIPKVIELLEKILPMGPDAFIVQDLGLANLIRKIAPEQRIHASTQMTVSNVDAITLLDDLHIERFVLARENSLAEIESIRKETSKELEVFVHGALCVAYSGQCFTSESIGGRSANRGQCAQSCRLPYEMYVDDQKKEMGEKKYLVSPKDLMGLREVTKLKQLGVNSFKVEGRLKTAEYVAAAAKNYREVLDGEKLNIEKRSRDLSVTYSRGFFSGWFHGVDHQQLVGGEYSAHRGIEIGKIKQVKKATFVLESTTDLKAGDGVLLKGVKELGSTVFKVKHTSGGLEVELLNKNLNIKVGDKVYLNSDPKLEKELQKSWQTRQSRKTISVTLEVSGTLNEKLKVKMSDPEGRIVEATSSSQLVSAQNRSLTLDFIFEELSSLGSSVYQVKSTKGELSENLFIQQREIKNIKNELILKMNEARIAPKNIALQGIKVESKNSKTRGEGLLNILLRTKEQVDGLIQAKRDGHFAGLEHRLGLIILDFEFGKDYAPSIEALKLDHFKTAIATTRILKPNEYNNLKLIMRLRPDKILVRNLGALSFLKRECDIPMIGDFSLNVTNSLSHDYLLSKGLESICCSYDLNQFQLNDLLQATDPGKLEVTLHQYMPEFHMEHCVFAAFLSQGSSFRDCGKPCEKHEVKLKDPYNNWHFLKADHECRNTFYKAVPQSASFLIPTLLEKNISALRLEALNETPTELNKKIVTYLKLLIGEITEAQALKALSIVESYGLGTGQLTVTDNYKNRKQHHEA